MSTINSEELKKDFKNTYPEVKLFYDKIDNHFIIGTVIIALISMLLYYQDLLSNFFGMLGLWFLLCLLLKKHLIKKSTYFLGALSRETEHSPYNHAYVADYLGITYEPYLLNLTSKDKHLKTSLALTMIMIIMVNVSVIFMINFLCLNKPLVSSGLLLAIINVLNLVDLLKFREQVFYLKNKTGLFYMEVKTSFNYILITLMTTISLINIALFK